MNQNTNEKFTGSLGIILAAVASAIGLGNIWKFPYITGVYGGSAFVIVYLLCVTLIGVPLLLSAFIIGRKSETDPVDAFKKLSPHTPWFLNGWLAIFTSLAIISFYSVVAGWAIYYAYLSATGGLVGLSPEEVGKAFGTFTSSSWQPLIWQLIFMIATSYIVIKDVRDGIERYSRLLMPLLLVLLISLDIRAVTLDGASVGLDFLFKPDFSKLTVEAVLSALGHSFFTLSIGAGTMITYGAYIRKKDNLLPIVAQIVAADTLIAILAGIAIFPAVFAFGVEPTSGPGLVFITLPNVFNQMPLGQLFSFVFFLLLFIAALTSAISLVEPSVSYLISGLGWKRKKATICVSLTITVIGATLSQGNGILNNFKLPFYINGIFQKMDIFGWTITLTDQLLPISGFFIAIFVGWTLDKKLVQMELSSSGKYKTGYFQFYRITIRFIVPAAIALIFLTSIFGLFK